MAPSIISHFRPHRRVGSTPTSPQPPSQSHTLHPPDSPGPRPSTSSPTSPTISPHVSVASQPPVLPPIARVTSREEPQRRSREGHEAVTAKDTAHRRPVSSYASSSLHDSFTSYVLPPIQRVTSQTDRSRSGSTASASFRDHGLDDNRKLSEPTSVQHLQRPSITPTYTRASFADFGRTQTASALTSSPDMAKPPHTPSNSSRTQSAMDASLLHPQSHYTNSPASSVSSFHKTASSTNLTVEASPASSRSPQGTSEKTPSSNNRMSRAKLNLLNPVSLLKRRRTSQLPEGVPESSNLPTRNTHLPAMGLPPNYDPRIKGKGIHDFDDGARPRRNHSTNDMAAMTARVDVGAVDTSRRRSSIPALDPVVFSDEQMFGQDREHAPVFVEHFEEGDIGKGDQSASAVQRESLANSQFLARMSKQFNLDAFDFAEPRPLSGGASSEASTTPPASAFNPTPSPFVPSHPTKAPPDNPRTSGQTDNTSARVSSDQSTARSSLSNETKATSPPQSPSATTTSRQSHLLEAPFQASSTSLSHLPSTASRVSRFSFQLNSAHSIEQEKALEEKHKAKHASEVRDRDSRFDDFDEEGIDYDEMMDDSGGYEEEIPTMGEDEGASNLGAGISDKRLSSSKAAHKEGEMDVTRASSQSHYTTHSIGSPPDQEMGDRTAAIHGLGLQNTGPFTPPPGSGTMRSSEFGDMYFDDGMIDQASLNEDAGTFDESLLDSPVQAKPQEETPDDDFKTPKHHHAAALESGEYTWKSELHRSDVLDGAPVQLEQPLQGDQLPRQHPTTSEPRSAPAVDTGLNAYHNALAEAATRAARDGKFSRQSSVLTASSIYTSTQSPPEQVPSHPLSRADSELVGTRQAFEDFEEEDDQFIAEANADVLASEDSDYYGQEFGFFRQPNASGDGQFYNGGYFGQPDLLGVSSRSREPNLTPITERSEYSTRNSIIGGTPWAGPPSGGPWPLPSSASQQNLSSPGLKEIAASMGMDDEDMTLGQLLRLRRETFGSGGGSGPHSAHVSSSSNDSSPTSQLNPSPLAGRGALVGGWVHPFDAQQRRPSEPELPEVQEEEDAEMSEEDSPIRDNVTLGTARAILHKSRAAQQRRRGSAEKLAQEYSDIIHTRSSPVPVIAEPIKPTPPSSPLQAKPESSLVQSHDPAATPRRSPKQPVEADAMKTPRARQFATSLDHEETHSETRPLPSPPTAVMQRFAQRPMPDAYRKAGQASQFSHHRRQSGADGGSPGTSSVAYVCERDEDGVERWFLEKRRQKSTGELIVIGREPVEGGRI